MKRLPAAFAGRFLLPFLLSILFCIPGFSQGGTSAAIQLDAVRNSFEMLSQSNAYVENLTSASLNVLPVGLKRVINNMEVTIAVDKVTFHPEYAEMSVFAKAILPQSTEKDKKVLFFGARGIKLSYNGSIIGDASLALLHDIAIPFNNGNMSIVLKGNYDWTTGKTDSGTYMDIDCKGFKELGLHAEVEFPTSLITNAEPMNEADLTVRGSFRTVVQNWNDIVAEISLPSFQIVGLDGFIFNLRDVVLDFSDSRNSTSVRFQQGYQEKYMIAGAATLWRGVYAGEVEVTLPPMFADTDKKPTSFAAFDMLIDDNGVSGLFEAENILSFERGDANGWNFSVDRFRLGLEANKLTAAGFGGEIGLPICQETSRLGYDAMIRENNEYLMQVSVLDSLQFSLFKATATLLPNSMVSLEVRDGKFLPEALLHGNLALKGEGDVSSDVPVSIPSLDFRSLRLKTVDPYIGVEYMGYNGKVSLGPFPVSLNGIALKCVSGQAELSAGLDISLDVFAAQTQLTLMSTLRENNAGRKHWQYTSTTLDKINLDASIAGVIGLKGTLQWHSDDPLYGDGFSGDIGMALDIAKGMNVDMRGCFGYKDNFRYWFVDGGVVLPMGIPILGPLTLKGLSGAVTQRMIPKGTRSQSGAGAFSSATYVPDKNTALGLKMAAMLDISSIVSGEACFEMAFSNSGGLNFIGFYGFAKFTGTKLNVNGMSGLTDKYNAILEKEKTYISGNKNLQKLQELKLFEPNKAADIVSPIPREYEMGIMGTLGIQYDFRNNSFHAESEVFINSPGNFIQGVGSGGSAGPMVLHIDPSEWYLHLGNPTNRLGVKFSLGNILSVKTGTYFMSGSQIPDMPPPPQQVANILKKDLSSLTLGRDIQGLSTGRGLAVGSEFSFATGDLTFLMMYANFQCGTGFDIMMKDYGHLVCAGSNKPIGWDGWFAQGQCYSYLQGELGVKINLWFLKTKFPIIKGGAAALLQASLPSPTAFKGYLAVNVNVLGLIKGNMRFKLSLGDECEPVIPGGSPLSMPIIGDLLPAEGDSEVNVFTLPQAAFNLPVNKPFDVEEDNGTVTYRTTLKEFKLTDENGQKIAGTHKWNSEKDAVSFQAKEILPPYTKLKAYVSVSFERMKNGQWEIVKTAGQDAVEYRECSFTTGGAPEYIPLENILYTYPVVDQRFYLPKEHRDGYVQLQFGQKYLFEKGFDYQLSFTDSKNLPVSTAFRYDESANRLVFTTPELKNSTSYTLGLSYTPNDAAANAADRPSADRQTIKTEDGSLNIDARTAKTEVNDAVRKEILNYAFATSRYATFKDKIKAINLEGRSIAEDAAISYRFLYRVTVEEVFGPAEVIGIDKTAGQPLIQPYAELKESFFTGTVHPLLYSGYPYGPVRLECRNDAEMGVPPARSVMLYPPYLDVLNTGQLAGTVYFPFSFETPIVNEQDFWELLSLVANKRKYVPKEVYDRFLNNSLPFLKKGKYKVILQYVLPDGRITSKQEFYYNNFLDFNK